jgi:cytochrome bd ubiquinol oxidase subunit I
VLLTSYVGVIFYLARKASDPAPNLPEVAHA